MIEMDERTYPETEPRVIRLPARRRWGWRMWVLPLCLLTSVTVGLGVRMTKKDWQGITPLIHVARPLPRPAIVRPAVQVARLNPVPAPPLIRPESRALRPSAREAAPIVARRQTLDLLPPPDHADLAAELASRGIEEESIRLRAEQAKIALIREHQPELDQKLDQDRRRQRIEKAIIEAEAQRPAFHAEVAAILEKHGPRAGPKLMELMAKQDSRALPEVEDAVAVSLKKRPSSTLSSKKIRLYRSLGVPEPVILNDLMRTESLRITARNGPKNAQEAMVRAARKLTAFPPGPRQTVAKPTGHSDPGM